MAGFVTLMATLGIALGADPPPAGPDVAIEGDSIIPNVADRSPYDQVVTSRLGAFRACYRAGIEDRSDLQGRVVLILDIGADGIVGKAAIKTSTLGSPDVEYCTLDALGSRKFPARAEGAVTAEWALVYRLPVAAPAPALEPSPAPAPGTAGK